ncbi:MAG: helix-hairpin-helix domain-containing protein [Phycisphaeraceae bacterium]|nr:helix-hairpin-helix domain-containing protein [Phycisphaeraceae bacterium]
METDADISKPGSVSDAGASVAQRIGAGVLLVLGLSAAVFGLSERESSLGGSRGSGGRGQVQWTVVATAERAEQIEDGSSATAAPAKALRIDLNAATIAQLELLPGIGPAKARAIVEDRERRGRFGSVEDLDRVAGIGPKTVDRLREHVIVGDESSAARDAGR